MPSHHLPSKAKNPLTCASKLRPCPTVKALFNPAHSVLSLLFAYHKSLAENQSPKTLWCSLHILFLPKSLSFDAAPPQLCLFLLCLSSTSVVWTTNSQPDDELSWTDYNFFRNTTSRGERHTPLTQRQYWAYTRDKHLLNSRLYSPIPPSVEIQTGQKTGRERQEKKKEKAGNLDTPETKQWSK